MVLAYIQKQLLTMQRRDRTKKRKGKYFLMTFLLRVSCRPDYRCLFVKMRACVSVSEKVIVQMCVCLRGVFDIKVLKGTVL